VPDMKAGPVAASGRRQNMSIVTVVLILCLVAVLHLAFWGLGGAT